uniref:Uncharacterized protein n=1 Tax=Peronospora matthiolae TaxID=2874970 RepID=A0AAV1ULW2_9STRA
MTCFGVGVASISRRAPKGKRGRIMLSLMCSSSIMDCSRDDMGYQKRGRTRSHELNMVA